MVEVKLWKKRKKKKEIGYTTQWYKDTLDNIDLDFGTFLLLII